MKKLMSMFGVISFLFALVLSSCGGADEVTTEEVATEEVATEAVSYTHLTLPTIYSV